MRAVVVNQNASVGNRRRAEDCPPLPINKPAPAPPRPVPTSPRPQTAGWPSAKTLALSVWHPPPAPILESSRASCSSPRNSLGGRPQGLRQRPGDRQRRRRIQFGRHDAHHVPARIYQCPARIARLHRQADLEIARVIRRARQRRRGNAEGRRMNEELTPSRAGCRLVSSFFILPSSFAFDPPWPPSRPVSPCGWRQSAAVQTAQRLSTKPDHSPHPPSQLQMLNKTAKNFG